LANPLSFSSCSHGAGRKMSRTKAKDRFSPADLARQTQGVECDKSGRLLEEIPAAYKNIDEVMAAQSDLVHSVTRLKQIITVKSY
ncbi:MAG TPA: RtcB family protein, partial [bacterium]|nr:RtcB family protein [bacterium]